MRPAFDSLLILSISTLVSFSFGNHVKGNPRKIDSGEDHSERQLAQWECKNLIYFPCTKEMFQKKENSKDLRTKLAPRSTSTTRSIQRLYPEMSLDVKVTSKPIQIKTGLKPTTNVKNKFGQIKAVQGATIQPAKTSATTSKRNKQTSSKSLAKSNPTMRSTIRTITTPRNTLIAKNAPRPTTPIRNVSPSKTVSQPTVDTRAGPSRGRNSTVVSRPTAVARIINVPVMNLPRKPFNSPTPPSLLPSTTSRKTNNLASLQLPSAPSLFVAQNQIFATTTARVPIPKTMDPRDRLSLDIDLRYRL